MQNLSMVLNPQIREFQKVNENKRIANCWPDGVIANIHINQSELNEKEILAGEGWTELRVYWQPK